MDKRVLLLSAALVAGTLPLVQVVPAAAGGSPGACPGIIGGAGVGGSDLAAAEDTHFDAGLAPNATATNAGDPVTQFESWHFNLGNQQASTTLSSPKVSVASGLSSSLFGGQAFPVTCSGLSLPSFQGLGLDLTETTSSTGAFGIDSSRLVPPAQLDIPVGGGQQDFTLSVKLDSRYAGATDLLINSDSPDLTGLVSSTPAVSCGKGGPCWDFSSPSTGTIYTVTGTAEYTNPYSEPWPHLPGFQIFISMPSSTPSTCPADATSFCLADPELDGGTADSGRVSFSSAESGHTWTAAHTRSYSLHYPEGEVSDLIAGRNFARHGFVGPDVNSVAATDQVAGSQGWGFQVQNTPNSAGTVSNLKVSIASGYPASSLGYCGNPFDKPIGTLPATFSQPNLDQGQTMTGPCLDYNAGGNNVLHSITFAPGFTSSRSLDSPLHQANPAVDPRLVPAGGGQQTITFTLTPGDTTHNFHLGVSSPMAGESVVSTTLPPLTTEQLTPNSQGDLIGWDLNNLRPIQYTFSVTLQVPNSFGFPILQLPRVRYTANQQLQSCLFCGSGASVTLPDHTLDASTLDSGQVTYSVGDPNHVWSGNTGTSDGLVYQALLQAASTVGAVTDFRASPISIWDQPGDGMAQGSDGKLYLTEAFTGAIGVVDPNNSGISNGVAEYAIPTANSSPYYITAGPNNLLWFTECGTGQIGSLDPISGTITEYRVPGGACPLGILAVNGTLWITDFSAGTTCVGGVGSCDVLFNFDPSGPTFTPYPMPSAGNNAQSMVIGPDGRLWLTEPGLANRPRKAGIVAFDLTAHTFSSEFQTTTANSEPRGIAVGPDGNLWFTEKSSDRIGVMDTSGTMLHEYPVPTPGAAPNHITLGSDGALWFTETQGNKVGRITSTGTITEYQVPALIQSNPECTFGQGFTSFPLAILSATDNNIWFDEACGGRTGKITPPKPAPTSTGSNVHVMPPTGAATTASLTFSNVTASGDTTVTPSDSGPAAPGGFTVDGGYFNIATTVTFTGSITICLSFPITSSTNPVIEHFESGSWVAVPTTYPSPGEACGSVTSLSPFGLFARPTTTTLASSGDASVSGQNVTYTATVSPVPDAGTVAFTDSGTLIPGCSAVPVSTTTGRAACPTAYRGPGTHAVEAAYSGDTAFAVSDGTLTQNVNRANTSTALAASANPVVVGQLITVTATLSVAPPGSGSPTGTMAFADGGTPIAGCTARPVSASAPFTATCPLPAAAGVGVHPITAIYSGDGSFKGSASGTLNETVNRAATHVALASSPNPSRRGQVVTLTATVSVSTPGAGTPAGSVGFFDGSTLLATVRLSAAAPDVASFAASGLRAGRHSISAVYMGDANYGGSTSSAVAEIVRG